MRYSSLVYLSLNISAAIHLQVVPIISQTIIQYFPRFRIQPVKIAQKLIELRYQVFNGIISLILTVC